MSEERKLPPDVAERFRARLAAIRLTMPHWGGGSTRTTPEREKELEHNIATSIANVLESAEPVSSAASPVQACPYCGAVPKPTASGKRTEIIHDLERHPKGEVPVKASDVKPIRRDYSRDTYEERLAVQRGGSVRSLGSE